ncbi:alginate export family protein [Mangrovibacterium diazotrophicum]|uniref:Alginate export protein n=1 Tax=Mangrovibacterium diazotrophicum TaxID=1261403 RepID=A0A419VU83_9BACT|nr:alginate export family protein [Mangrovibacterium diazotrophicum]RKD85061.1 alginate export protein [Mangrovibacterium diazotrophicum]
MKTLFALIVLVLTAGASYAQFTLEGQLRPRTELRNGFKKPILPDQEPAVFTEQRTRLVAGYKAEKYAFKLSIQDVRIWGETGQINKSDQLLSAHEAYGEYYASGKSTFRIGRQEVIYDGHRLFGSLDWAAQGRSLDALRYLYKDEKGNQFDLMAAWNQAGYGDGSPEPAKLVGNAYVITTGGGTNTRIFNLALPKAQLMAYYKKTLKSGDLAFMLLDDIYDVDATSGENYSNTTFGFTPNFTAGKVKFGGQFFYTGGANGKTETDGEYSKVDLSGYMANAYVQFTGVTGSPLFGVDYLSGDDESTTDKVEGWAPKYGTNHKFYGFMDYFYVGNGHGGVDAKSAGLVDIYLQTAFKLSEKAKLVGHLHYFSAPEARTNATTGESYDGYLGTELDLVFNYALTKGVVLSAGYSQMFGISDTMKQLKLGDPTAKIGGMQSWGWLMINFSPKFL